MLLGVDEASLLFRSALRIFPVFLIIKLPEGFSIPLAFKAFMAFALSLVLSQKMNQGLVEFSTADLWVDLFMGICIGLFIALVLSASAKAAYFFFLPKNNSEESEQEKDAEIFEVLAFVLVACFAFLLKIEKSLLTLLAKIDLEFLSLKNFFSFEAWSLLLTDVMLLSLKFTSLGFFLVFSKLLMAEFYKRIGGEPLSVLFTASFWILLLVLSPMIIPSYGDFVGRELSSFWSKWMGF
jgi:hypothetical protein